MSSQKRKRSPESRDLEIFRSEAIEDRSSTFIGYFSPSLKPKDLQNLSEHASASHKILAWRRESNQQSITGGIKYVTGHDDDGEKFGGKRVEKILENMQVSGACVVARWYGGVLLGPVRFTHIENCAKEAVGNWRESEAKERSKKRKAEDDAQQLLRLVSTLEKRDESIAILRKLATEKDEEVEKARLMQAEERTSPSTNGKVMALENNEKVLFDYHKMPVERLKALEKARDATLSFLLKRIDTAEADLDALKKSNHAE